VLVKRQAVRQRHGQGAPPAIPKFDHRPGSGGRTSPSRIRALWRPIISWPPERTIGTWGRPTSTGSINGERQDRAPVVRGTWVTGSISRQKPPDRPQSPPTAIASIPISMVDSLRATKRHGAGQNGAAHGVPGPRRWRQGRPGSGAARRPLLICVPPPWPPMTLVLAPW